VNAQLPTGTFMLSIDTELAWGSVYNGSFRQRLGHYARTREAITRLLALSERYHISATWAVVGHLFLDQCRAVDGIKHPEIIRPEYSWFGGDWFDADPSSDLGTDPFWYGPDIVGQIQECRVPQEIGCHGFSHMIAGDLGCSRECFASEIRACREQAAKWGVTLQSFVFPRNSIAHLDVLAEQGFTTFRGPEPAWYGGLPGPCHRPARAAARLLPLTPPAVTPRWDGALWDIPASFFYPHRDGVAHMVPVGWNVHKANLGLAEAARQRGIFHMWFHPFNLASDPEPLLAGLESIFQRVDRLRAAGKLANATIGGLAQELNASQAGV